MPRYARELAALATGVCLLGAAPGGGGAEDALRMTVRTNSVPAVGVPVRAGQELIRTYHLRNNAEYGLRTVKVVDPQVFGGVVPCPRAFLKPLETMVCRAVVPAAAGRHVDPVTATGNPTWEKYRSARVSVPAGYDGHASALTLRRSASQERLSYHLTYSGPAPLDNVRLRDPLLSSDAALRCPSATGLPRRLAAGQSVECWAPAPKEPGRYESVALVSGTMADRAVSPTGTWLPPLVLSTRAAAGYSVPRPAAPVPVGPGRNGADARPRGTAPRRATTAGPRTFGVAPAPGPPPAAGQPPPPANAAPGQRTSPGAGGAVEKPLAPTAVPSPPATQAAERGSSRKGRPLEESVDWVFLTLMIVLFPALLVAITSSASRGPGSRGGN